MCAGDATAVCMCLKAKWRQSRRQSVAQHCDTSPQQSTNTNIPAATSQLYWESWGKQQDHLCYSLDLNLMPPTGRNTRFDNWFPFFKSDQVYTPVKGAVAITGKIRNKDNQYCLSLVDLLLSSWCVGLFSLEKVTELVLFSTLKWSYAILKTHVVAHTECNSFSKPNNKACNNGLTVDHDNHILKVWYRDSPNSIYDKLLSFFAEAEVDCDYSTTSRGGQTEHEHTSKVLLILTGWEHCVQ